MELNATDRSKSVVNGAGMQYGMGMLPVTTICSSSKATRKYTL